MKVILEVLEWVAAGFVLIALQTALEPSTYWKVIATISVVTILCGCIFFKLRRIRKNKEKEENIQ